MRDPKDGPFLLVAALCSHAAPNKSGHLCISEILPSTVFINPPKNAAKPQGSPARLVVLIGAGLAIGRFKVAVEHVLPDGTVKRLADEEAVFDGEKVRRFDFTTRDVDLAAEGAHWFDVFLDGERLTRVLMSVIYVRASRGN